MPIRSKGICSYPGCNTLTMANRCSRHPYDNDRGTAKERGYDTAWNRLRNAYVRQHPVCELKVQCDGAATEEVDHIIPIDCGGARLDEKNLQGVCRRCHSWKTNTIDRQRVKKFRW